MTIAELAMVIQMIFGSDLPNQVAREVGFIQRKRKISGASFLKTLVFFWLGKQDGSTWLMSLFSARAGGVISRQGLAQRFTTEAVIFLETMLEIMTQQVVSAETDALPILNRFCHVNLMDSMVIPLPDCLQHLWAGCGTRAGKSAALKVVTLWDMVSGRIRVELLPGKSHDQKTGLINEPVEAGSLSVRDLGFFCLDTLAREARQGGLFLTRYKLGTTLLTAPGKPLALLDVLHALTGDGLDRAILLGKTHQIPCRLIAVRVPEAVVVQRRERLEDIARKKGQPVSVRSWELAAWTLLLTNASPAQLTTPEVLVVARYRWQIELLFKVWKNELQVDEWGSQQPERILCEVYAKLMAGLLLNWLVIAGCWCQLNRSLVRARHLLAHFAWQLLGALPHFDRLLETLQEIVTLLPACRIEKSRQHPRTFQTFDST